MVVPEPTPVTLPDPSTEPITVAVLLHVPPTVASVNAVMEPIQTSGVPEIAAGTGLMVTVLVEDAEHPVIELVTVAV